jgi:serine phosphatase RsbU (regulator of sigma subunit)
MLPEKNALIQEFGPTILVYKPRDELSGDFYWSATTESGRILCLADCMGHGVPGALVTTIAITHLRTIVHDEGIDDPGEIIVRLHHSLLSSKDDTGGIDIAAVKCDRDSAMSYAAARMPVFVVNGADVKEYTGSRYAAGSHRARGPIACETSELPASTGDMIFMSSDGLFDQPDTNGKRLGSIRVRELLHRMASEEIDTQESMLLEQLESLDPSQRDDIAVVGIRVS